MEIEDRNFVEIPRHNYYDRKYFTVNLNGKRYSSLRWTDPNDAVEWLSKTTGNILCFFEQSTNYKKIWKGSMSSPCDMNCQHEFFSISEMIDFDELRFTSTLLVD